MLTQVGLQKPSTLCGIETGCMSTSQKNAAVCQHSKDWTDNAPGEFLDNIQLTESYGSCNVLQKYSGKVTRIGASAYEDNALLPDVLIPERQAGLSL